jgi:putative MATE family efflux protein
LCHNILIRRKRGGGDVFKRRNVDITGGPIVRSIIVYAIPIIIGTLVQVLFNAADVMIVGNMSTPESNAVASVGATTPIINLLVNSFVGLSVGVGSVLARCLGQRNDARVRRVVNTAMIFALAIGIVIMTVFMLTSKEMLRIMKCPDGCFDGAVSYFNIYAIGIPAIMLYNFGAAIVRTQGDTERPFIYLTVAGVVNVILNVLLCLILENKVAAVAIATTVSQTLSCILILIHLFRLNGVCGLNIKKLSFSIRELWEMLKIGAPCALNSALFSISNLQIQTELNSFGENAIAGNTAAGNLEHVSNSISMGFVNATVPFVGQNAGAGNKERVKKSIVSCVSIAGSLALLSSAVIYLLGKPLISLFAPNNPEALAVGTSRMKYVLLSFFICITYNVLVSAMQAFGYSFIPMLNSIITVLGFRLVWMWFVYPVLDAANRTIDNLYLCYPISWTLSLLAHLTTFLIIYTRYRKGKIKAFEQ